MLELETKEMCPHFSGVLTGEVLLYFLCKCLPSDKVSDSIGSDDTIGWFKNGPGDSDASGSKSLYHYLSWSRWSYVAERKRVRTISTFKTLCNKDGESV